MKTKNLVIMFAAALLAGIAHGVSPQNEKPWSVRMVESEMIRNPEPTQLDFMEGRLKWNYTIGLELQAMLDVYDRYDLPHVWDYAVQYADTMINDKGEIVTYKLSNYNIDHICPGRMLFRIYDRTGDMKYRRAMRMLREQLETQPRTSDGGFWHKKIYPNQMWLDGLYMGGPFYSEYASRFESGDKKKESWNDIIHDFTTVAKHTYDPVTKLYRHAWDESREQFWADPETGQSQHAWLRAVGWYAMGIVEVLDYMPRGYQGTEELVTILQNLYKVLPKYADPKTGMWYQVMDRPGADGNYLESTGSAMLVYTMLKGIRKGYLDKSLLPEALRLYDKFIKTFIREEPDGTISLTMCCSVAGLGGKDMRDGSYTYYLSEPVRDNDAKGIGPFIWASLEVEYLNNTDYVPDGWEGRPLAFPGAEGGGKYTTGGRGGKVLYVTSLADDGSEGTFRWAIEQNYPRTVLFAVDGNIELQSPIRITHGNLTIAGQSAPGEGVCITNHGVRVYADNVIIRYMRFRMGDAGGEEADALEGMYRRNVIIDHCSMSWSTDECSSFYANNFFTMQWCIISESLTSSIHEKGEHGYGAIWGGRNASYHHNLLAHHASRNPRLDHPGLYPGNTIILNRGSVDYVNNVVYNWGFKAMYGGEAGWWNVRNNYYIPGAASKNAKKQFMEVSVSPSTSMIPGRYYVDGNVLDGSADISSYNWSGVRIKDDISISQVKQDTSFAVRGGYELQPVTTAYEQILKHAGASRSRDAIDKRIVSEVRGRKFTYTGSKTGQPGLIDSQSDAGGWAELKKGTPPVDSDGDGIPDKWETKNGLNPTDPSDGAGYKLSSEYTNLEVYLNSLVR